MKYHITKHLQTVYNAKEITIQHAACIMKHK